MANISELADQCVRCGLCLPHCPTYRLSKEEPESPRGRIQLLAAFAQNELTWQPELQQHVDQCLSCGHCERVCPAKVSYKELLIQGREALAQKHPIAWWKKLAIKIIETPWLRKIFFAVPSLRAQRKIDRIANFDARSAGEAGRAECPESTNSGFSFSGRQKTLKPGLPPRYAPRNDILLFPGCTGENFGRSTFIAAKNLLTSLGYNVHLPPKAFCCGALRAHAGLGMETTEKTLTALIQYCEQHQIQQVITFATGCGGFLASLPAPQNKLDFVLSDIQEFFLDHDLDPLAHARGSDSARLRIAVHSPCTQTNALGSPCLSYDLLKQLPNVELIRFGENTCCGAAGSYMFEHPTIANQLIAQLLTPELLQNCDVVVTSNIGCQLHFQRYLKAQKIDLPVCHPIEILATYVALS